MRRTLKIGLLIFFDLAVSKYNKLDWRPLPSKTTIHKLLSTAIDLTLPSDYNPLSAEEIKTIYKDIGVWWLEEEWQWER